MSNNIYHGTNIASTSLSTRNNVCVDETSVNAEKEHIVMAKSGPLTAVRNLMGEFDGVKITKKNVMQRKKTLQNEEEQQQNEREWLHALKRKQHKNIYPKNKQETGHDANTNCTIVSHSINHDTNIAASSTSNIQNIQLDETPLNAEREDPLSSNDEEVQAQVQTQQNKRKQYKHRQTTEWRTEQMCQYRVRKQPKEITLHNDAQRLPIARQIWKFLMRIQSVAMM